MRAAARQFPGLGGVSGDSLLNGALSNCLLISVRTSQPSHVYLSRYKKSLQYAPTSTEISMRLPVFCLYLLPFLSAIRLLLYYNALRYKETIASFWQNETICGQRSETRIDSMFASILWLFTYLSFLSRHTDRSISGA
jgi:hypothetical protein